MERTSYVENWFTKNYLDESINEDVDEVIDTSNLKVTHLPDDYADYCPEFNETYNIYFTHNGEPVDKYSAEDLVDEEPFLMYFDYEGNDKIFLNKYTDGNEAVDGRRLHFLINYSIDSEDVSDYTGPGTNYYFTDIEITPVLYNKNTHKYTPCTEYVYSYADDDIEDDILCKVEVSDKIRKAIEDTLYDFTSKYNDYIDDVYAERNEPSYD